MSSDNDEIDEGFNIPGISQSLTKDESIEKINIFTDAEYSKIYHLSDNMLYLPIEQRGFSPTVSEDLLNDNTNLDFDKRNSIVHGVILPNPYLLTVRSSPNLHTNVLQNEDCNINFTSGPMHFPSCIDHNADMNQTLDIHSATQVALDNSQFQNIFKHFLLFLQNNPHIFNQLLKFGNQATFEKSFIQTNVPILNNILPQNSIQVSISVKNSTSNHDNVKTYAVPVEANFHKMNPHSVNIFPIKEQANSSIETMTTNINDDQYISILEDMKFKEYFETNGEISIPKFTDNPIHHLSSLSSDDKRKLMESMSNNSTPGFVLLSVRHEFIEHEPNKEIAKVNSQKNCPGSNSQLLHSIKRGRDKNTLDHGSNKRFRKIKINLEGSEKENKKLSRKQEIFQDNRQPSRFRVTRIADSSCCWMDKMKAHPFVVHDLRTSNLPEYVIKQLSDFNYIKKFVNENDSYISENIEEKFWEILEPQYFDKINMKKEIATEACQEEETSEIV